MAVIRKATFQRKPQDQERLDRLSAICLELPQTVRQDKGHQMEHAAFLTGKKTFAWYVQHHHGDGIVGLWCKALPGEAAALIAASPDRFYRPDYLGAAGWVGLRLDRRTVDWREVRELVTTSYRQLASKRLVIALD